MCGRYNFESDDNNLFDILNALNGQVFHTGEIFPTNSAPTNVLSRNLYSKFYFYHFICNDNLTNKRPNKSLFFLLRHIIPLRI